MSPAPRSLAVAVVLGLLCALAPSAWAQPKGLLVSPGKPASPPTPVPPAPPLPQGCAAPTKEQCATASWYTSDRCATAPATKAAMLEYCTWVFKREWSSTAGAPHTALFPVSPPSTLYPILAPARRVDRGKNVVAQPTNRPMNKRRFPGATIPPPGGSTPSGPLRSASWTPTFARSGAGSMASLSAGHTVGGLMQVQRDMDALQIAPQDQMKATQIYGSLLARPAFVPTPGPVVGSCEEYAYKRWGDYSAFASAAKRLGRNWRQVYALATDPSSPVFVNKQLVQTSTSTPTPLQLIDRLPGNHWDDPNVKPNEKARRLHDIYLPLNAFYAMKPTWLTKPGMPITAQQRQQIDQKLAARTGGIRAKSDTSPLGLHKEAKARFDTVYGNPHDDELADIARRTKAYQDLLAKRAVAMVELACANASDPCLRCSTPNLPKGGFQFPAGLQKLKEQISGDPVINPADVANVFQSGGVSQRLHALVAMQRASAGFLELDRQLGGGAQGAAQGGMKQKVLPELMQLKVTQGPQTFSGGGMSIRPADQCLAGLVSKRPALEAEIKDAEITLTRLLVNELAHGDRGCLAVTGNNQVNLCDWSYELFAAELSTVLDADVEQSFKECRAEVTNAAQAANVGTSGAFAQILKSPPKQALVYPCVQRRDFTATAPEAARFMELNGNHLARNCEVWRQQSSIQEQQRAIAGEMAGLKWKPQEGEIYDDAVDSLELGSKDSVGAYFDYAASWKLKKNLPLANGGDPMSTCRFEGSAKSKVSAGIYFFGDTLELFKLEGDGSARKENGAPKVTVTASSSYFDMSSFSRKQIFSDTSRSIAGETYAPLTPPSINLGGGEVDFWVTIGPVPVHIVFGAVARAGIAYKFAGSPGDNCANANAPSNFKLASTIEPWVRADAYADASIDVVVAAAGVRLDLLLMRLGIPLAVNVENTQGTNWNIANGGRVGIDMLSGRLTGYVEVGVAPLEESWEAEIFGWDGFHTDVATWGLQKSISSAVVRVALAGSVSYNTVQCDCAPTYCCSMLGCPGNNCPGMKAPNGTNRVCTFNTADVTAMVQSANGNYERAQCHQFVYP